MDEGLIYNAWPRYKWEGDASVIVSTINMAKGYLAPGKFLAGRQVTRISAFLVDSSEDNDPIRLSENANGAFEGMSPYGAGFLLSGDEIELGITGEHRAAFPYIGGKELNESVDLIPRRNIVFFEDMSLEQAEAFWPDLCRVLRGRILPDRAKRTAEVAKAPWWLFWRPRMSLWNQMKNLNSALCRVRHADHHAIARIRMPFVPDTALAVFPTESFFRFGALQSRIHEFWARSFASSIKDDMRYTPSDCYRTFLFSRGSEDDVSSATVSYEAHRASIMIARNEGLTKTYNRFHNQSERAPDIQRLRELHHELDLAVLRAYGWSDLAARAAPEFLTEETEPDHRYQGRLFWPAPFRDEVLVRLLDLNRARAAEERSLGLSSGNSDDADEDQDDAA